ncbi:MAG TPA: NAD(P)H-hydrate dehydratase [Thiobacillus sp.]
MTTDLLNLVSPPLYRASDIRTIEAHWAEAHPETSLMEKAGTALAQLASTLADESGAPVLILAGPGNNGGDALVAARRLQQQGIRILVVSQANPGRLPPNAARAWAHWHDLGNTIHTTIPNAHAFSLVMDGLFGVGLQRDIAGSEARWIEQANAISCPKLAIDLPSGLDSDSGQIRGCAFRADHTLTFLGLKPGLLTADGLDLTGTLTLDTLGIDAACLPATTGYALTQLRPWHQLPIRLHNSHKGSYGHVGVIGGTAGMVGACLIAGRAALRQGAGSVTLGVLDDRVVVDYGEPRLMLAAPESLLGGFLSVLVIGPGLGSGTRAHALVETALSATCPLVLDADALSVLANDPQLARQAAQRHAPTLLTPHPGEAARLLHTTVADIQLNRIEAAHTLSQQYSAEVALKGAGTVIAHPNGRYAINTSGGPWLAQAGSGDRLAGMLAALLGQGMAAGPALEAAVWLHGTLQDHNI